MAEVTNLNGTVKECTRNSTTGRSVKVEFPNTEPPPTTITVIYGPDLDKDYYDDFKDALAGGLKVDVKHDDTQPSKPPTEVKLKK